MSTKHEDAARKLSRESRAALVDARPSFFDRIELPDLTSWKVMGELTAAGMVHGRFLTTFGEVVRHYVMEQELEGLG